jgi:hypothetical protein
VLSARESRAAESLLATAWGTRVTVRSAEMLWERSHVLGADWDVALAAALGGFVVARAPQLTRALEEDRRWGTTTIRPRLLAWLASFTSLAATTGALPRLRALAETLHARLAAAWPEAAVPDYPALARPGHPVAQWRTDPLCRKQCPKLRPDGGEGLIDFQPDEAV